MSILKAIATGHRELIFLKAHIHGIIGAMEVCAGLRERNSRKLFEGLEIAENQALCDEWMNRYPAISISFRQIDGLNFMDAYQQFVYEIALLYQKHAYLLDSQTISSQEKSLFQKISSRKAEKTDVLRSIQFLTLLWTLKNQHQHIQAHAVEAGFPRLETITKPMVQKILRRFDIKPHKIKYYCERRDPDFETKMHDVLLVYKQVSMQFDEDSNIIIPTDGPMVHTVSCDEKPGIQAIATAGDDLRSAVGNGCVMRDAEYKRLGTLSLLAGIDLLTGEAIPYVSETHKNSDFIELLKKLDAKYPENDVIRIVCDNHSAHKSKETRNYLATRPEGRVVFVFTPKHGSWLNMIESFLSKMTKQMLKGIRVKSKEELECRIYRYFEEVNREPVVYHWTYKMDEISVAEAKEAGVKSNEKICAS